MENQAIIEHPSEQVLRIENLSFSYRPNKPVLKDVTFLFETGKTYSIMGRSGAGKTTLLSLIAGLETAQQGRILFNGQDLRQMDKESYRSQKVGVVFQHFNLLPHLNALENVVLSMDISGDKASKKGKTEKAIELLKKVGLDEEKAKRRVLKLSGGEQQRVAIARALSFDPQIIIADEPTGNLDGSTEKEIMDLLIRLAHEDSKCVIVVTHAPGVSEKTDVIYHISD